MRNRATAIKGALSIVLFLASQTATSQSSAPLDLAYEHTTASVADLEKEATWYEQVLGFRRSAHVVNGAEFAMYQMIRPGLRIDLVQQRGSVNHRVAQGRLEQGWLHVVFTTPDLGAAYKFFVSHHVAMVLDKDDKGKVVHLTLHDPEGNEIGIVQR